jgi:malate dehydrogenase
MGIAKAISATCPAALIFVITNPVNSLVPLIAEVLKQQGPFDPRRLFGVTTVDVVRASTFASQVKDRWNPPVLVAVVGGHSTDTIVPLFSQTDLIERDENIKSLTKRVQWAADEVINAKAGAGSATLCMAYAAARYSSNVSQFLSIRFVDSVLRATAGQTGIIESTYVHLGGLPGGEQFQKEVDGVSYFSAQTEFGVHFINRCC